jgi:hypothetical protein
MLLLRSSSHDYGYSQYNQRARVEGQIARWKQVIGDGLRFHSDEAQATEVAHLYRVRDIGGDGERPAAKAVAFADRDIEKRSASGCENLSAACGHNQRRCRSRPRRIDFKETAAPTFEEENHRTRARSTWPLSVICTGMR